MSGSDNMCFTLPNLEPIGSELDAIVATDGEENSEYPLQLPHPSPTDPSTLFLNQDGSHARRQHPGHIPRPRNAFILFRCDFVQQRVPEDVVNNHRDLSRIAGYMWRKMSVEQKQPWFEKAELEKRYHAEMFPLYRYAPIHPERPKRVYHKKKPLVPEEILLRDPHSFQVQPRLSSSPQHSFPSTSSPVLPPRFTDAFDNESPAIQHQGFPQSHTHYHSAFSRSHSSVGQAGFPAPASINHPSLTPPREFSPPDSRYYELSALWPNRETVSQDAFETRFD
ncbi:Sex-determining region Y protein [Leucoagaricus sp. SymC.cos]|nr:Sex-determining region Y protein [Leucoagaricus sp. SymC.cos]